MPYVESEWTDDFDKYRETVSQHLMKFYYISWDDACGDEEPIRHAIDSKQTPTEFAEWWALKYDLISVFDGGYIISRPHEYYGFRIIGERDSDN